MSRCITLSINRKVHSCLLVYFDLGEFKLSNLIANKSYFLISPYWALSFQDKTFCLYFVSQFFKAEVILCTFISYSIVLYTKESWISCWRKRSEALACKRLPMEVDLYVNRNILFFWSDSTLNITYCPELFLLKEFSQNMCQCCYIKSAVSNITVILVKIRVNCSWRSGTP